MTRLVLALMLLLTPPTTACISTVRGVIHESLSSSSGNFGGITAVDDDSLAELSERIETATPGNFYIYFNSPGGEVMAMLRFIGTMESAKIRGVHFVCIAELAASAGAVIYSTCDERKAIPRALFLIHSAAVQIQGNAEMLRNTADDLEAVSDAMLHHICRVVTVPFEELKRRAGTRDYWLDVGRAKDIGLVQEVVP